MQKVINPSLQQAEAILCLDTDRYDTIGLLLEVYSGICITVAMASMQKAGAALCLDTDRCITWHLHDCCNSGFLNNIDDYRVNNLCLQCSVKRLYNDGWDPFFNLLCFFFQLATRIADMRNIVAAGFSFF